MKIVIVGGGFAGVNLALDLAKSSKFEVTLVDKNNYNFFPPLIYQVATAFLEPSSISYPFRKLFSGKENLHFRLGELVRVIPGENKIVLDNGEVDYDFLVFATGAETNFFGMENVKRNATPMKTLEDAIGMRNKMLMQMEKATLTEDPAEVKKLLTVVIAGGGPTGVEISGMFAEMRNGILRKEYPELAGKGSEIYLVDGGDALLSPMSVKSQKDTYEALRKLGVKIKLNTHVVDFVDDKVFFSEGETIESKTLIWAAGVTGKIFEGIPAEAYGRGRRLIVDAYNKVTGAYNIYAIGDASLQTTDPNFPNGHPQVAQVAIQQGKNLARNFELISEHLPLKPFGYHDKGSMAIIGRAKAVVDLPSPKLHFKGIIAWLAWLFIHLISLINHRNRMKTLYNWMIAYFTKDQSLRMIIKPSVTQEKVESV
ncbi:NAD(P)/FAD-dependent oxidoreductase [Dyadobacter pollutisoli]|uniref:NADH:ubiquinone reductase (non-electrogenic) n=1 Tax=Dyadobacter pollutisoli TaxID=2910158 RepID=A0A9E8N4A5_9BACT|nr:NAD(P)/FAD-dependent oxidoreductase [Dyadobacter pollutisoli]WAC09440.1 NAD(P)/FAD-dependent oxidoreductase [Dyadobacter pollutisoli]